MPETKYAVITGGSKGLGFSFAKYLAIEEGYSVILIARAEKSLNEAVAQIENAGGKAFAFSGDVSDIATIRDITRCVAERFTKVDFLINNACVLHVDELKDLEPEDAKKDIDIGLFGSIICTKFFSPLIKDSGRILFVSSGFGLMGAAGYPVYSAVKAGVINFAQAIKRELHKRKIKVYVAVPSDIDTPGFKSEVKTMPAWMGVSKARGKVMPADSAARRILKKCKGKRFLVFSDVSIRILYAANKILPAYICEKIIDNIFPRP